MSLFGYNMKTVIQPPGWNPFQTFMLGASVAGGISGLFARNETSSAVAASIPYWILCIWYTGLMVGGILGLVGMFINFRLRVHVKIAGIGLLGGISLGYSLLIAGISGRPLAYPVIITFAFSLACITRTIQLIKILQTPSRSQEVIVHE